MNARLLPLALFLLALTGCGILPSDPDASGNVIMPLNIGNQWIGKLREYNTQGHTLSERLDTIEIVGSFKSNDEIMYKTATGESYINRADGLWSGFSLCDRQRAKYPARRDDLFDFDSALVLLPTHSEPVQQKIAVRVVHTDTTVTVPAGTYRTYHYNPIVIQPDNATFVVRTHSYYVPNLGPVLIETFGATHTRWELVRAVLK